VGSDRAEAEPGAGVADVKVKERDPKRRESSDSGKSINAFQWFSSVWRDDEAGCKSNRDAPFDAAGGELRMKQMKKFELLAAMLLDKIFLSAMAYRGENDLAAAQRFSRAQ
jgi:hypothetical protein